MRLRRAVTRIIERYERTGLFITASQLQAELRTVGFNLSLEQANGHLQLATKGRLGVFRPRRVRLGDNVDAPYVYLVKYRAFLTPTDTTLGEPIPRTYDDNYVIRSQRPLTETQQLFRLNLALPQQINAIHARLNDRGSDEEVLEVESITILEETVFTR